MSENEKIILPSGGWVVLRDPKTIRVKDRKNVMKASDNETGDMGKALALSDGLIAMMVKEWSFDLIPPSIKISSLDELEIADYDALVEHVKEVQKILYPQLAQTDESEKDAESPFVESND